MALYLIDDNKKKNFKFTNLCMNVTKNFLNHSQKSVKSIKNWQNQPSEPMEYKSEFEQAFLDENVALFRH